MISSILNRFSARTSYGTLAGMITSSPARASTRRPHLPLRGILHKHDPRKEQRIMDETNSSKGDWGRVWTLAREAMNAF
jgi:hypothetical protein